MRNTGSTSSAPPEDVSAPTTPSEGKALLVIENASGRESFLSWAEKHLPEGDAIVEVRGLVGRRRAFRTVPTDPRAELVAMEAPLVMRGSLTALVHYYRVPVDGLDAEERHYEDGEFSHKYEVPLKVARLGKKGAAVALA
jgi:hypothetical protein